MIDCKDCPTPHECATTRCLQEGLKAAGGAASGPSKDFLPWLKEGAPINIRPRMPHPALEPDYETRLWDEVAARLYGENADLTAKDAFDAADAFMAERKRRGEAGR